jgi:hypothetical protein
MNKDLSDVILAVTETAGQPTPAPKSPKECSKVLKETL